MPDSGLHEPRAELSPRTQELHRAVRSLIEELEAVDWYSQRVDASRDEELRRVLAHSLREEKEHAAMTLEWIRRNDADFADCLRRYLFVDGDLAAAEAEAENGAPQREGASLALGSLRADAS